MEVEYLEDKAPFLVQRPINLLTLDKFWSIKKVGLEKQVENFLIDYSKPILEMPAARNNHHWWTGGWRDHTEQVIYLSLRIFGQVISFAPDFNGRFGDDFEGKLVVASLLHDAEKLSRYKKSKDPKVVDFTNDGKSYKIKRFWEYEKQLFVKPLQEDLESIRMAAQEGFPVDTWLMNAICFAAGGFSDLARKMEPNYLSVIIHAADYISANILFNVGHKD